MGFNICFSDIHRPNIQLFFQAKKKSIIDLQLVGERFKDD